MEDALLPCARIRGVAGRVTGRVNIGRGRSKNQDALGLVKASGRLLLAAADGLGCYEFSEHASLEAVTQIPKAILEGEEPEGACLDFHRKLLEMMPYQEKKPNGSVAEKGSDFGATTFVMADVKENMANVYNIGDSRAFQFRGGRKIRQTRDQSALELLRSEGRALPDDCRKHPLRSVLLNALGSMEPSYRFFDSSGAAAELETGLPAREEWNLKGGDFLVLATDGFYNNLPEEELAALCALTPWKKLNDALHKAMQKILHSENNSPDNYSYLVYRHV
ncbi:MAG: serine/threonine-protein phosphatase [Deltaproteobacteria bacterium]|nr:serine/threonine-protein phosphatase [Deltaproteobacteria bacterium]